MKALNITKKQVTIAEALSYGYAERIMKPFAVLLITIILGCLMPIQSSINALLGGYSRHPLLATFISFAGGFLLSLAAVLIVRPSLPTMEEWTSFPWYVYCGGILGFVFVTAVVILVPRTGILLIVTGVVVGQLVFSALIDHFGFFGVPVKPLTWMRVTGIGFLIAGLFLVNRAT